MGFGIVSSLAGIKARENELEVLANNIANVQTIGFKELSLAFSSEVDKNKMPQDELARAGLPVKQGQTYINQLQGGVYTTNNSFDLAIQGDGFFAVQTAEGVRYTRNGNFTLDNAGVLKTMRGHAVLSSSGPVTIPQDGAVQIGKDGMITVNGNQIGAVIVQDFTDREKMQPVGGNYYSAEGLTEKDKPNFEVLQGSLESSNVNIVGNITKLIAVSRSYESLQKTIKQQIESGKSLSQVARL